MDWSLFLGLLVGGAKKYILKDKILHEFKLLKLNAIQDYRVFNLTSSTFLSSFSHTPRTLTPENSKDDKIGITHTHIPTQT